jgi:hypothetical protein
VKAAWWMAAVLGCVMTAGAQSPLLDGPQHSLKKDAAAVEFLFPEQVTVPAGKESAVALHFRVAPGQHVNSHTPKDEFLIPTVLTIPAGEGVVLKDAVYPKGVDVTLPINPKTKLNVYSGEFAIDTRIVAERGNHLVQARLRYQACDNNACMPPKTITVAIDVIGQ